MFARPAVVVGSVAAVLGAAVVFLSPALAPNRAQADGMDGWHLPAAVAEIERINTDRTPFYYGLLSRYPDTTSHRSRVARWAVDGVCRRLRDDPRRLAEAAARLNGELRLMLARGE